MNQLALAIGLADHAVFRSFHAAGNETPVAHLQAIAAGADVGGAWLCGAAGSGKSHLLQAACAAAGDRGRVPAGHACSPTPARPSWTDSSRGT